MNPDSRIVLDTSTLISAALKPRSMPGRALLVCMATATLCVSPPTLAELEIVLMRDKFDPYLDRQLRERFLQMYRRHSTLYPASEADEAHLEPPCRDPKDNKFLALARHCAANLIVSSDADLLVLNPWQGIPILTPAQFLSDTRGILTESPIGMH